VTSYLKGRRAHRYTMLPSGTLGGNYVMFSLVYTMSMFSLHYVVGYVMFSLHYVYV
jgi:hypothetical protein